jgi:hypothetical protein
VVGASRDETLKVELEELGLLGSIADRLTDQQVSEARELIEKHGEYEVAWEFLVDWLIDNEASISSQEFEALKLLATRMP